MFIEIRIKNTPIFAIDAKVQTITGDESQKILQVDKASFVFSKVSDEDLYTLADAVIDAIDQSLILKSSHSEDDYNDLQGSEAQTISSPDGDTD
jgi:hypothetical protein